MTNKYLIDSSAFIFVLYQENSSNDLDKYLASGAMHHISIPEVLAGLVKDGMPEEIVGKIVNTTITETIDTNIEQAHLAANIRVRYQKLAITTEESFCLATAKLLNLTIVTANKNLTWIDIGVEIICVG